MPILHKFQDTMPGEFPLFEFYTESSILKSLNNSFKPETLIIGTFNHGWAWNPAEFFYARGMYLWPIFSNLFTHNGFVYENPRGPNFLFPPLTEMLQICLNAKISFCDIVKGTTENLDTQIDEQNQWVTINNEFIWQNHGDPFLNQMGNFNWLEDNTASIINFINENLSIQNVYFTFNSGNWLNGRKNEILNNINRAINSCNIFTPTGLGFRYNLGYPFNNRLRSLTHCWVWNGLPNPIPVNKVNYGHLDHDWLIGKGVDINQF